MARSEKFIKLATDPFGTAIRLLCSKMKNAPGSFLFLTISTLIFLLISADCRHYWDEAFYLQSTQLESAQDIFDLEPALADGRIHGMGFYTVKSGFIYFLNALTKITGNGSTAFALLKLLFALMTALTPFPLYFILKRLGLGKVAARNCAFISLFSPVMLYLGHKVMSEVPSFICALLAILFFLRCLQSRSHVKILLNLILCSLFLVVAITFRLTGVAMFGSFCIALFAFRDDGFKNSKVAAIFFFSICLTAVIFYAYLLLSQNSPHRYLEMLRYTANKGRDQNMLYKYFNLGLEIQLYLPFLLLSLLTFRTKLFQFASVWALLATIPVLIGYVEPRFLFWNLPSLSILIYLGFERTIPDFDFGFFKRGTYVLASIVLMNLYFVQFMPYEINERDYRQTIAEIDSIQGKPAFIVPWITDYLFLRFVYPDHHIYLSYEANSHDGREPVWIDWIGSQNYVGDMLALNRIEKKNLVFIGWDYNPVVKKLSSVFKDLGLEGLAKKIQAVPMRNHLEESWLWRNPQITMVPIIKRGQYSSFEITVQDVQKQSFDE